MICPLNWWGRGGSPFLKSATRPLQITLHVSSFVDLSRESTAALEALEQLTTLDAFDVLRSAPSRQPYFEIGELVPTGDYFKITTHQAGRTAHGGVNCAQQLVSEARRLSHQWEDSHHPETTAALADLIAREHHNQSLRDVFVTESKWLHVRTRHSIADANVRSIAETLKLVGLLLRSRGNYVYWADGPRFTEATSRYGFYWVLTRHHTPQMWRYMSACVLSGNGRNDDTSQVGRSILLRCCRALQARDQIAQSFYVPQNGETQDEMMYHFEYLTLLLTGAVDAMARIARRAYGLAKNLEYRAGFRIRRDRRNDFMNALRSAPTAQTLYALAQRDDTQALLTLLYDPRNTIHGASLSSLPFVRPMRPELGRIDLTASEWAGALWDAAGKLGGADEWGLTKDNSVAALGERIMFEPYNYAVSLVRETLKLVDEFAAATEVERLFAPHAVPHLLSAPPEDEEFGSKIRERFSLLG